jgi:hypothetical protein
MNNFLDDSLVALVLLVSAGYVVSSLGPKSLRHRFLQVLSRVLGKAPAFLRLGPVSEKLSAAAAVKAKGACGGCDNCGSEQTPAAKSTSTEIAVSVEKIGRRT